MAELSPTESGNARENLAAILQALSERGQGTIAQVMAVSDSSMSRWKSDEIPVMAKFLGALGLKVVPQSFTCFDPEYLRALRTLARVGLEAAK